MNEAEERVSCARARKPMLPMGKRASANAAVQAGPSGRILKLVSHARAG